MLLPNCVNEGSDLDEIWASPCNDQNLYLWHHDLFRASSVERFFKPERNSDELLRYDQRCLVRLVAIALGEPCFCYDAEEAICLRCPLRFQALQACLGLANCDRPHPTFRGRYCTRVSQALPLRDS